MLIIFEGNDYSGKTFLMDGFEQWLAINKVPYKRYAEPGGTETGKILRGMLKSTITDATLRQVLMTASRVSLNKEMTPYLKKGGLVICDRYTPSMVIHGTLDRVDNKLIQAMADQHLWVDLYVHTTISHKVLMDRISIREGEFDPPEGTLKKVLRRNKYYQDNFDKIAKIIGCSRILTLDGSAHLGYNVNRIAEELRHEF